MKKNYYYVLSLILIAAFFIGCVQENDYFNTGDPHHGELTVMEAKEFFENFMSLPSTREAFTRAEKEKKPVGPGEFTPLWEKANVISSDHSFESVDIPINAEYNYKIFIKNGRGGYFPVGLSQKLVVVKVNGELGAYIMNIAPSYDMYKKYKNNSTEKFLNGASNEKFTGSVFYTSLGDNMLIRFDYYDKGIKIDGAYLYETENWEANCQKLDYIQEKYLYNDNQAKELPNTRGQWVYISSIGYVWCEDPVRIDYHAPESSGVGGWLASKPSTNPPTSGGGGGGANPNPKPTEEKPKEEFPQKIKYGKMTVVFTDAKSKETFNKLKELIDANSMLMQQIQESCKKDLNFIYKDGNPDSNGAYNPSTNTIELYVEKDYHLYHELTHLLQHNLNSHDSYYGNMELETQMMMTDYYEKAYPGSFNTKDGVLGKIEEYKNNPSEDTYKNAVKSMQEAGYYKNDDTKYDYEKMHDKNRTQINK